MKGVWERLKSCARALKRDIFAFYLAFRDKRLSLPLRLLIGFIIGYALSPIDLIPDFIPILGYLDDLILVPLGMLLLIRLTPPDILEEHRQKALVEMEKPEKNWVAAVLIILFWVLTAFWIVKTLLG